jgi:TetR/AcrR family transcriptional regulator, repressor for neighboring sulfatase
MLLTICIISSVSSHPRRRRTPEQARAEILDAGTGLIAERGPDGASLRQVAEAAGVTHGLVVHYFGTYRGLVGAVLQRANERQRDRIREQMLAEGGIPYADRVIKVLFRTLGDEKYVRLWAWTMLHPEAGQSASEGLAGFVDAFEAGVRAAFTGHGEPPPDRARIETVVLLGLSASYGYALGRRSWLAGLGHDPSDTTADETFAAALTSVVAAHLGGKT